MEQTFSYELLTGIVNEHRHKCLDFISSIVSVSRRCPLCQAKAVMFYNGEAIKPRRHLNYMTETIRAYSDTSLNNLWVSLFVILLRNIVPFLKIIASSVQTEGHD